MSDEQQIDVAGVKVKAGGTLGKVFMYGTAIATVVGGLYGGFEVYKDYMDMKKKIESYTAPDLSGFDKKLAVLKEEMLSLKTEVQAKEELIQDARDYTKEIKTDLKDELHIMSKQVDDIEKRGKNAFRMVRDSIETNDTKVRKLVTDSGDRFDKRREQLRTDMDNLEDRLKKAQKELEDRVSKQITKALNNPLNAMAK
jgi:hypothetical protein|tara:strand:+ start:698 stop:1291 length:594 start_codon:yes stop_codon:yes gene_type:complete